jgi:acetyl esterase/lipase
MRRTAFTLLALMILVGCGKRDEATPTRDDGPQSPARQPPPMTLATARSGFATKPVNRGGDREPVDVPPPNIFRIVKYKSPVGELSAYLSPDPKDGKKHPAIIWIHGGDCNSIGEIWMPANPKDDQSARQYREAGIPMMFPSLRGGNDNPGVREGFYGEVDDVLAAADFLAKQEFVDPSRIYLGGHSTGGTLVMLVAASSDRFRAVFSFGPADDVSHYPNEYTPFNKFDKREVELRSPGRWLQSIQSPTFVFEGTLQGNIGSLQSMARTSKNPKVQFFPLTGMDHFSTLSPTNRFLAQKILKDDGPTLNIAITAEELKRIASGK